MRLLTLVALVTFVQSCGTSDESGFTARSDESLLPAMHVQPSSSTSISGLESQGMQMQGMQMQGMQMQGMQMQGMQMQGMQMQGMQMQGMQLDGTVFSGRAASGPLRGTQIAGATVVGIAADGREVLFLIRAIEPDPADRELLLYTLDYHDAAAGAWKNACVADQDGVRKAIPLSGTWDQSGAHQASRDLFTFGCTSGAIAKCVRWGYKPWKTVNGRSVAEFHQACTRMARADYCGNGRPHTRNGTLINVYDVLGIQTRVPNDGMLFEAAWVPGGAYCVSRERWSLLGALLLLECPERFALPGLADLLNRDSCAMKLSQGTRSSVLISNRSYIQLAL